MELVSPSHQFGECPVGCFNHQDKESSPAPNVSPLLKCKAAQFKLNVVNWREQERKLLALINKVLFETQSRIKEMHIGDLS